MHAMACPGRFSSASVQLILAVDVGWLAEESWLAQMLS